MRLENLTFISHLAQPGVLLIDSFELIINNQQGLRNKCLDNNNLLLTDVEGNQNHSYLLEKQIKTLKQKIDELQSKKNVVY